MWLNFLVTSSKLMVPLQMHIRKAIVWTLAIGHIWRSVTYWSGAAGSSFLVSREAILCWITWFTWFLYDFFQIDGSSWDAYSNMQCFWYRRSPQFRGLSLYGLLLYVCCFWSIGRAPWAEMQGWLGLLMTSSKLIVPLQMHIRKFNDSEVGLLQIWRSAT